MRIVFKIVFRFVAVWNRVEEKFCKKLVMWKRQYLSKGERTTLIQSTLPSMPIYFMSLFCILRTIKMRLE